MERSAHPDDLAIAEEFVVQLEANAIAKVEAQSKAHALSTAEVVLSVLELCGVVSRRG